MSLDLWLYAKVDVGNKEPYECELYDSNITHNIVPMWNKAGVYDALYNSNGKQALELIDVLETGLEDMLNNPAEYKMLNPKNGWGSYEGACRFLDAFLNACKEYPKAIVGVSK